MKNSADQGGCYPLLFIQNIFKLLEEKMCSLFFCSQKNNTISSPGFLDQRFNLQRATLLASSVQYEKILSKFVQQQLVMANYECGYNQQRRGNIFNE